MQPLSIAAAAIVIATGAAAWSAPKGLTITDVLAMQRVGDPAVSPDGKQVAFAVRDTDYDANQGRFNLWLASVDGGTTLHLTTSADSDTDPQWTPDGRWIYFKSTRGGSSQVWRISPSGGEASQVTRLPIDVAGFALFPDGKRLALAMDVWPDAKSIAESARRDAEKAKAKVKARIYDQLLFRHWDQWEDGKYSHLFVWSPSELGGKVDNAVDLTPGMRTDTPTHPFSSMADIAIAPDGKLLAFVARVGGREIAWTTNTDIFLVASDGKSPPVNITAANKAYDYLPRFSPDGTSLAIAMMTRPGYESDRQRLAVISGGLRAPIDPGLSKRVRVVTEAWDRSIESITWSADGRSIYTSADNLGNRSLFSIEVATGGVRLLVDKGTNTAPAVAGNRIVFARDTLQQPTELFSIQPDGTQLRQITHINDDRLKAIQWGAYEQFSFKGAKGDTVHGFIVRPVGWAPGRKYPVVLLIHGGPQGSMGDHFHYWPNPEVFAGRGYGVVMIDFHGSTGYGQAFTDSINGDWGGAPYDDLMMGLDAALANYAWLDGNRAAAIGRSFGGYMVNWINGKTKRFKALVCHAGNNDERAAYLMTEELWFPEWEHRGTPWQHPEGYAKDEPFDLIKNWSTPTLVIHGALDFRVSDTSGLATFTALQRKGVPSRLVYFPDEGHWILKPQNSKLWNDEVLAWIDRFTRQ